MNPENFDPNHLEPGLLNSILRILVLKYGGLSCAPNLANSFDSISNSEMYQILECLVDKGMLRRINDDDPELIELTRFPEQAIYQLR